MVEGMNAQGDLRAYGQQVFADTVTARIRLYLIFSLGTAAGFIVLSTIVNRRLHCFCGRGGDYFLHGVSAAFVRDLARRHPAAWQEDKH